MISFTKFKSSSLTPQTPLVILHGLFGSKQNWKSLGLRFSAFRDVYSLDLRNHGDSFHSSHSIAEMCGDVEEFCKKFDLEPHFLGHSMGGKVVMNLLLKSAHDFPKAVVVDIAPRNYSDSSLFKTYFKTMKSVNLDGSVKEAEEFMKISIPQAEIRAFLLTNLKKEAKGLKWRVNLKGLEESMPDLWGFSGFKKAYDGNVLFVRGGNSDYITGKDGPEMTRLFPSHQLETIANAGHWVHAEKPNEFIKIVNDYLA